MQRDVTKIFITSAEKREKARGGQALNTSDQYSTNKMQVQINEEALIKMLDVYVILSPGSCIIKLIKAVIYGFRNKQECLSLNTRLG